VDIDMGRRSCDPLGVLIGPLIGRTEDNHDHSQYALRALLLIIMTTIGMPLVPFWPQQ
jgi:hypothetical protein